MSSYRELIGWQNAMDVVVEVYRVTRGFPPSEQFTLTNQLRRAAVSIPSNIAEGQGRGADKEFCHSLRIARGSIQEVETQLLIAQRLNYCLAPEAAECSARLDEVSRILAGLICSLTACRGDHR